MTRVLVLGGTGWFGRSIIEHLGKLGIEAAAASRRGNGALRIDANDPESIRVAVRRGDLMIDAAGPYHLRSMALIEAAIEIGCDVIDINDDLSYAQNVLALESRINAAGIRVLSSASTVSAVAAAVVRYLGVETPVRVSGFLVPAARHSVNPGAAMSLLHSVGRPIHVWRGGRMQTAIGWSEPQRFPMPRPLGSICGRLFETADAALLPRIWPSLQDVAIYVDANVTSMNSLLRLAGWSSNVHRQLERHAGWGLQVAKWFGSAAGGVGYEVEDERGGVHRCAIVSRRNSYLTAIAAVILAAREILEGRCPQHGLVPADKHVEPATLFRFLESLGIEIASVAV